MAIPPLDSNFMDFIKLLNEKSVEYLLIGGYAVAHHGFVRATKDIDFWFNPTPNNCQKLEWVTRDFGVKVFLTTELLEEDTIFQLGYAPVRIDLINTPIDERLPFAECYARAETALMGGVGIKIISLGDLITLKKFSARDQDLVDIRRLGGS
jgi:predicted nucleotidyltransferase